MYLKPLNLLIFLVLCLLWIWWIRRPDRSRKTPEPAKPKRRRKLRPRTPKDCAQCRVEADRKGEEPRQREVIPWSEVKSPRGRPPGPLALSCILDPSAQGRRADSTGPRDKGKKRIDTEGYACPTKRCDYRGVTDASIHALVGYGSHGKSKCIQDFFCQACKTKFTVRRDTPLYRLKTSAQRVGEVLSALALNCAPQDSTKVRFRQGGRRAGISAFRIKPPRGALNG